MDSRKKAAGGKVSTSKGKLKTKLPGAKKNTLINLKNEKYEDLNFIDSSKPVWNYSLLTDED
ncbi:MAG: hypothetical protein ABJA85_05885, partial [Bacteroidota bacterium]